MDTAYRLPMAGQLTDIEHGKGSELLAASRDELDVLGRFITKDPSEERGGLNLYRFCRNNGVNACDRLGLMTFSGPKEGDPPPNYADGWTWTDDPNAVDPFFRYFACGWDGYYSTLGFRSYEGVSSGAYACAEAMNALMDQNMGYNSGQAWADLNSRADEAEARQENPEATVTAGTYALTYHKKSGTSTATVDGQLVAFGTDSGFSAVLDQIGGGWNVAGGFGPNSGVPITPSLLTPGNLVGLLNPTTGGATAGMLLGAAQYDHYNRNDLNVVPSTATVQSTWTQMSPVASQYHRLGPGAEGNLKYISPDGHSEAVINRSGNLVTDIINGGTYNFVPPREPITSPSNFLNNAGHAIFDVAPFYLWGNGPNDPRTFWQRLTNDVPPPPPPAPAPIK